MTTPIPWPIPPPVARHDIPTVQASGSRHSSRYRSFPQRQQTQQQGAMSRLLFVAAPLQRAQSRWRLGSLLVGPNVNILQASDIICGFESVPPTIVRSTSTALTLCFGIGFLRVVGQYLLVLGWQCTLLRWWCDGTTAWGELVLELCRGVSGEGDGKGVGCDRRSG